VLTQYLQYATETTVRFRIMWRQIRLPAGLQPHRKKLLRFFCVRVLCNESAYGGNQAGIVTCCESSDDPVDICVGWLLNYYGFFTATTLMVLISAAAKAGSISSRLHFTFVSF
jgi:hypothetical protein